MTTTLIKGARPSRAPLTEMPPEYKRIVYAMVQAANEWLDRLSGAVFLRFAPFPEGPTFTGNLDEGVIQFYGQNDITRELLRVMDRASNHEATLMMARIAVDIIEYGED